MKSRKETEPDTKTIWVNFSSPTTDNITNQGTWELTGKIHGIYREHPRNSDRNIGGNIFEG